MRKQQMTRREHLTRERPRLTRVLRLREVEQTTGIRRSTIYESMEAGTFPRPIKVGPRAVGWLEHEIVAWLESRTRGGPTQC
jgi:prophage regulatory protein